MRGCVCHLGVYCVHNDWKNKQYRVPIYQCLFFNAETHSLHTFLVIGNEISENLLDKISISKEKIFMWDLNEQIMSITQKTESICELMFGNKQIIQKLSRTFIFLTIILNSNMYEIIDVCIDSNAVLYMPDLRPMIIRCVGNYSKISSELLSDSDCTQATKKMRFDYHVTNFCFSLNVNGKKVLFSSTESSESILEKLLEFFTIQTYKLAEEQFLMVTPKNFFTVLFDEDMCLLLLQTVVSFLYDNLFRNKLVVKQVHDYIGPDLWPQGHERAVYFVGFPNMWFLSIYDLDNKIPCSKNICNRILLYCGLPDSLGPDGCQSVPSTQCVDEFEDLPNLGALQYLKYNSLVVTMETVENSENVYYFFGEQDLFIVKLVDIIQSLLELYVPKSFLPDFSDAYIKSEILLKFISRLHKKSNNIFCKIVKKITEFLRCFLNACRLMDLNWMFIRNMHIVYFIGPKKDPSVVLPLLKTSVESCWKKILNSSRTPVVNINYIPGYNFLHSSCSFLTSGDINSEDSHWTITASKCLYNCLGASQITVDFKNIYTNFQQMVSVFLSHRYENKYWIEYFEPNNYFLETHEGLLDCNRYTAVWTTENKLIRQSVGYPLTDKIDFIHYIQVVIEIFKKWLLTKYSQQEYAETVRLGSKIISDHLHLFNVN